LLDIRKILTTSSVNSGIVFLQSKGGLKHGVENNAHSSIGSKGGLKHGVENNAHSSIRSVGPSGIKLKVLGTVSTIGKNILSRFQDPGKEERRNYIIPATSG